MLDGHIEEAVIEVPPLGKVEIFTPAFKGIYQAHDVVTMYDRLAPWGDSGPASTSSAMRRLLGVEISIRGWSLAWTAGLVDGFITLFKDFIQTTA